MLGTRSRLGAMAVVVLALVGVVTWQVGRPTPEEELTAISSRPVTSEPGGPLGVSIAADVTDVPDTLVPLGFETFVDGDPVGSTADAPVTFDLRPGQLITIHVDGTELDLPSRELTAARSGNVGLGDNPPRRLRTIVPRGGLVPRGSRRAGSGNARRRTGQLHRVDPGRLEPWWAGAMEWP